MSSLAGWATSLSVDVADFVLVTWAVPAGRVRPHVPQRLQLDTFSDGAGIERAWVTTTCFRNRGFRYTPAPAPRLTFWESTFRTYVRSDRGEGGAYFIRRYVETRAALAVQRPIDRHVWRADFAVEVEHDEECIDRYRCDAAGERGDVRFALRIDRVPQPHRPFDTGEAMVQFLTYRLSGFFAAQPRGVGHMPVEHPRMTARQGELLEGSFEPWREIGVLDAEEVGAPYCVLAIRDVVPFRLLAPRPAAR